MGGCFRLGESLGLCILIFCLLTPNCFHSFDVWMCFLVSFVCNCLGAVSWGKKKMLIILRGFAFIYKYIFPVIFHLHYWQCSFFLFLFFQ